MTLEYLHHNDVYSLKSKVICSTNIMLQCLLKLLLLFKSKTPLVNKPYSDFALENLNVPMRKISEDQLCFFLSLHGHLHIPMSKLLFYCTVR